MIGVAIAVALVATAAGSAPADRITDPALVALRDWVKAVETHTPGHIDASVAIVVAYPYKTREDLNDGLGFFFALFSGQTYEGDDPRMKALVDMVTRVTSPDRWAFLKRAAILHSDAGIQSDRVPMPFADPTAPVGRRSRGPVPPLLLRNRVVLNRDGQILGDASANWNWPFARSLVGWIPPEDPFVRDWYHAVTAYMFAAGLYGEAALHLQDAARAVPDDALVLFDRACYAEILGLPMHQALRSDPRVVNSMTSIRVPPADKTNVEAEQLFRRALALDPSLVEARVRMARVIDNRGRHEEAAEELTTALAQRPSGEVAFHAHLFAGRAAQALGRREAALEAYDAALALYPDAQSALLAKSRLALAGADLPETLAPVRQLGPRSANFAADPWWVYHLAAGRDANSLVAALWKRVSPDMR